ncbi:hypothetical protein ACN0NP_000528 [Streptococcus equinus]
MLKSLCTQSLTQST